MLLDNVLVEKWYIPVKQDESLGVCLTAAISLAQNGRNRLVNNSLFIVFLFKGKLDSNADCKRFIEDIVPEAFRKVRIGKMPVKYKSVCFSYKTPILSYHGRVKFNVVFSK